MVAKWLIILSVAISTCGEGNFEFMSENPTGDKVYWEDLTKEQREDILSSKTISHEALELFRGRMKLSDDSITFALLDSLSSVSSGEARQPLYFFLFNRICLHADGSLAEALGDYCQRVVLESPEFVIGYFRRHDELLKCYARSLAYEMYFKAKGNSTLKFNYRDFKKRLSTRLGDQARFRPVLKRFLQEIEVNMKAMND